MPPIPLRFDALPGTQVPPSSTADPAFGTPGHDEVGDSTGVLVRNREWDALSVKLERRLLVRFRSGSLPQGVEPGDVVGEVLIKVMTNVGSFEDRGEESFWRWVLTIAGNVEIDLWRRFHRAGRLGLRGIGGGDDDELRPLDVAATDEPSPTAVVRVRELERVENDCIARLSEPYRTVYVLRRHREMSYAEIGQALGVSNLATLRSHFLRARAQVRSMLRTMVDRFGTNLGGKWRTAGGRKS